LPPSEALTGPAPPGLRASGTLDDGRSFDLLFVEVDLELLRTKIVFE
jgi:hypothetical protein